MPRGIHIIQGTDLRSPVNILANYDVIVCNPSLDPSEVRAKAKPGAAILASFNAHSVSSAGPESDFFVSLREAMGAHAYYHLDGGGDPIQSSYGDDELARTFDGYDAYARWIAENSHGYDGLYLDELWAELPKRYLDLLGELTRNLPNSEWCAIMCFFLRRLRELAPGIKLVGNIGGGWPVAPGLDAITVEKDHIDAMEAHIAIGRFWQAREWSGNGALNVAWGHPMEAEGLVARGDLK